MLIISKFKPKWWYDTILCYSFGMWFAMYKKNIEKKIKSNEGYYYFLLMTIIALLGISLFYREYIYIYSTIYVLSFVLCIVFLGMKVKLNSSFLKFMGANVFYIYIYQRIPMILLDKYNIYLSNRYLFLIISFVLTILITLMIHKLKERIDTYVGRRA